MYMIESVFGFNVGMKIIIWININFYLMLYIKFNLCIYVIFIFVFKKVLGVYFVYLVFLKLFEVL